MRIYRLSPGICLLLILIAVSAAAQLPPVHPGLRLQELIYENSSGERGRTEFRYDRLGHLRSGVWSLDDGSRLSANHHEVDAAGRETVRFRVFSDSLTSTDLIGYDADGRRLHETFERSDGVGGTIDYGWDGDRLERAVCRKYKGWFDGTLVYEYEAGRRTGARILAGERQIGTLSIDIAADGRPVSETWRLGGWSQTFTYVFERAPEVVHAAANPLQMVNPSFRVRAEGYDFNGRGGGPSTYAYAVDGRLAEKVFTRSDGLRTCTTYDFAADGRLLASQRRYHDGRTCAFTYRWDASGRLAGKIFRRSDGAEGSESYRYDRFGRLSGAAYENMDFWLNGDIDFAYDDRGHLVSGRFTGRDGYDADLSIDTDAHGNVTRVHWVIDGGMTQTYTFEYERVVELVGETVDLN